MRIHVLRTFYNELLDSHKNTILYIKLYINETVQISNTLRFDTRRKYTMHTYTYVKLEDLHNIILYRY